METGQRLPLVIAELVFLGVVLAAIPDTVARVALGLLLATLLARTAWTPTGPHRQGPPEGLPERRSDHLFRHWVNVLVRKIREFHAVCEAVRTGRVNASVGETRIQTIEREVAELLSEVTDLAKPTRIRQRRKRRPGSAPTAEGEEGG